MEPDLKQKKEFQKRRMELEERKNQEKYLTDELYDGKEIFLSARKNWR